MFFVSCLFFALSVSLASNRFNERLHRIPADSEPHLFIIGAPKSATTSLYELFLNHSEICPSRMKEIHYFDNIDVWMKGSSHYLQHFPKENCPVGNHFIDSTPSYLHDKDFVPERMNLSFSPVDLAKKKFIAVLRDPVDREYSWYNHLLRNCAQHMKQYMSSTEMPYQGWNTFSLCSDPHCKLVLCRKKAKFAKLGEEIKYLATFSEYYESNGIYFPTGIYLDQLKVWLRFFKREQFFIVNFTTLLEQTTDIINNMADFFGLNERFSKSVQFPHQLPAGVESHYNCSIRKLLNRFFEPYNQKLYILINTTKKPKQEPYFLPFKPLSCE